MSRNVRSPIDKIQMVADAIRVNAKNFDKLGFLVFAESCRHQVKSLEKALTALRRDGSSP
jgi:hypothetical protein